MSFQYKTIDEWKMCNLYTKIDGVWKEVKNLYYKIDGEWKPIWTYSWKIGEWGECDKPCGGGTQLRSVECLRSDSIIKPDAFCSDIVKPETDRICNPQSCWTVKWHMTSAWGTSKHEIWNTQFHSFRDEVPCDFNWYTVQIANLSGANLPPQNRVYFFIPDYQIREAWIVNAHRVSCQLNGSTIRLGHLCPSGYQSNWAAGITSSAFVTRKRINILPYLRRNAWNTFAMVGGNTGGGRSEVDIAVFY